MENIIKTRDFVFKPADYLKILFRLRIRKYGPGILVIAALILVYIIFSKDWLIGLSAFILLLVFVLFLYYRLKIHVYGPISKKEIIIQRFEFHQKFLKQYSSRGEAKINYSEITRMESHQEYLLIFIDEVNFLYIPKDAVSGEEEWNRIHARL